MDAPTTANYLEKIFQLSYTLPPITPDGCKALLHAAMAANHGPAASSQPEATDDETEADLPEKDAEAADLPTTEQLSEALILSADELATLDLVAPLVAITPRRAKRFGNVYTVVRARFSDGQAVDTAALAVTAAILLGAPKTLGEKLRKPTPASTLGLSLKDWVTDAVVDSTDPAEVERVETFIRNADRLSDLEMKAVIDILPSVLLYV
ncbi:hypothetical protein D7D52_37365 [Nocardia yunnanensis]|uniref:GPP34 family phosphoprotein n=1 Tax=Nocardia yunnanensis TaxID=2382165 RepID=A0A386ZN10_9NOCA|nr:hypothetical protein D7D52_37365 [Nocardia yunnanensis]